MKNKITKYIFFILSFMFILTSCSNVKIFNKYILNECVMHNQNVNLNFMEKYQIFNIYEKQDYNVESKNNMQSYDIYFDVIAKDKDKGIINVIFYIDLDNKKFYVELDDTSFYVCKLSNKSYTTIFNIFDLQDLIDLHVKWPIATKDEKSKIIDDFILNYNVINMNNEDIIFYLTYPDEIVNNNDSYSYNYYISDDKSMYYHIEFLNNNNVSNHKIINNNI